MLSNALKKRNSHNKQFERQGQITSVPTPYFSSFNFKHKHSFPTRSFLRYSLINHLSARKKKNTFQSLYPFYTWNSETHHQQSWLSSSKPLKQPRHLPSHYLLHALAHFPGLFLTPDSTQQLCESNTKAS